MSLPAIGSLTQAGLAGRPGVVVGAQRIGTPQDGRQLVALTIERSGAYCADCAGDGTAGAGRVAPERPASGPRPDRPGESREASSVAPGARGYEELSSEERGAVDRLRQRDQQVRQEEKAHAGAAGDLGGPISYIYQRGPDGRLYAVGGSVPIQSRLTSGDPAEAERLGARLAAAAHAATNPSGADLAAARQGYGLQGKADRSQGEAGRGAAIDVSA